MAIIAIISSGYPVNRDFDLDSSFPAVMANFQGIVGCIHGDDRRAILYCGNLKCFEGRFIDPGSMDIYRRNCAGKGEARSDQSEHSACSRLPFYNHHS
jgi:hypothetical protein